MKDNINIKNSKILFELLPESEQPKKTVFAPRADIMKHGKVIDIGSKVEDTKIGDIITVYVTTIVSIDKKIGFVSERDVLFTNKIPPKGKVHIGKASKDNLSVLNNAYVINANTDDISKDDHIYYKAGHVHELPDNTEIISENQIYYTSKD